MSTTATSKQTPPPLLGPELARRAAEIRRFRAQQETERSAFEEAISMGCIEHRARPGEPCWKLSDASRGICQSRVSRAIGMANARRERETREKALTPEQREIIEEGRRKRNRTRSTS